jgi:hypothetical protein
MFDEYANEELVEGETQEIDILGVKTTTKQAVLYTTTKGDFWAPKSISRTEGNTVVLPDWFDIKYVKPNNPFK